MDDLQAQLDALFGEELQDGLRKLSDGVAALPDAVGDARDELARQLFRTAHSLKGAAHSAGATAAMAPCHRLEERLADVRSGDQAIDAELLAVLRADIDALAAVESGLAETAPADPAPESSRPSRPPPHRPGGVQQRARVAVGRLDQLVDRSSALVVATERVGALASALTAVSDEAPTGALPQTTRPTPGRVGTRPGETIVGLARHAAELDRQLRRLATDVADTAQQLRLQPFSDVVVGLDRTLREVGIATGTQAQLVITGGDVEMDRDVGDAVRDALGHLVRNAIDHGIEGPSERADTGKPSIGTVTVSAAIQADRLVISVADDGAGVDVEGLRDGARRLGVDQTDDQLAFHAGLSTAATVTDVSGRGVGLDAVRATVEAMGGAVSLHSQPGTGTRVDLRVPRSLAVIEVHVVRVGAHVVAVLSDALVRLHRVIETDVDHLEGRALVRVGDFHQPAFPMGAVLDLPGERGRPVTTGIAIETSETGGVLVVDDVVGEAHLVLKPLPRRLGAATGALGAALLPDGRPVIVVNPTTVLREGLSSPTAATAVPAQPARRRVVLLAEDTLTTRALERSILEGAGYEVLVAVDGSQAWRLVNDHRVDVVVSDVDMPGMTGIELCRAIRASRDLHDIPVVLVTSLSSEQDRAGGLAAGANAYIVKSAFEQQALLAAVGRLL